ncbi:hypothetical protein [Janibacter melonis]|uniref:hypothetical protein n=1 Tax=Janibacter melonis TaxID=262209 RepID=UPI002095AB01|nr:hypothetical protein [Janibacter melonis]
MPEIDIAALRDRVRAMERTTSTREPLSRSAVVDALVPGGLVAGCTYAVHGSHTLLLSLLAGGSAQGRWCGLVGLPDLGIESARGLGLDLERTLAVPSPARPGSRRPRPSRGPPLVAVRPPHTPSRADVTRLSARLRARSAALVVLLGDAPSSRPGGPGSRRACACSRSRGPVWPTAAAGCSAASSSSRSARAPVRQVALVQRPDGLVGLPGASDDATRRDRRGLLEAAS